MYLMSHHRLSQRRACALLMHPRSTHRYRSVKDPQLALRQRMREIAQVRLRYGYRRIHVLLRREGWKHSRGKTYRLYTEERLQLRSRLPKRRKMVVQRNQRMRPAAPDDAWTMDFVADQLANGTRFRALTVVDVFTREALASVFACQRPPLRGELTLRAVQQSRRIRFRSMASLLWPASQIEGWPSSFLLA